MGNVLLHAFNWKFKEIHDAANEIKTIGYRGVLISPPSFSEGDAWHDRYQPIDYRIIHSPLGDLKDLKEMIRELKQNGLDILVDIVFNHMAHRLDENLTFPGSAILAKYSKDPQLTQNRLFGNLDENLFSPEDFNPKGCIDPAAYDDPNKVQEVQDGRICDVRVASGLPDLNYKSQRIVDMQQAYLTALKELGVTGFRIDAAKHMPVEHIQRVFTPEIVGNLYVFGEIIPAHHGHFLDKFLHTVNFSAYDFSLFYSLHQAFKPEGTFETLANPPDLDPFRSLTFAVTHDIPNNDSMRQFILDPTDEQRTDENLAYAYLLGRDGGVPLIYSDKGEDDGVYSNLWKDAFRKPIIQQIIFFHNALFGKKMTILSAGPCHLVLNREGAGIVAINKCSETQTAEIFDPTLNGSFTNILTDESITIAEGPFPFTLPARSCALYLHDE